MSREDGLNLRPHVTTESLGLDRAQDDRNVENPGGFAEDAVIVDDRLAVKVANAKEHLRLKVNDGDNAIVRREQPLFAAFG